VRTKAMVHSSVLDSLVLEKAFFIVEESTASIFKLRIEMDLCRKWAGSSRFWHIRKMKERGIYSDLNKNLEETAL